jgi:putative ABC transport system permease protein
MAGLRHDLRDAVRSLSHAPAFTVIVALTLALGIGVNTAIFSVVDAALFRPLPYEDPDRLVRVAEWPETGGNYTVAPAALLYFREHSRAFTALETTVSGTVALLSGGDPEELRAARVTPGYFDVLGIRPERGSVFHGTDPDAGCRVVISHPLWSGRFNRDPALVGREIRLDAGVCTVIGVLPIDAFFNRASADIFLEQRFGPGAAQQQGRVLTAIGRLSPGVSLERARTELAGVAATFNATRGPAGRGWTIALTPLRDVLVRVETRRLAWILIATVGAVLLVACVNVAGLSLSRTLDRRREVAVRAALGATRSRLFRALIVEGLLLAGLGGGLALLVGAWTVRLFIALMPATLLPASGASLNGDVLLFTMGLSLITGLLFGTIPAWQGAATSAVNALGAGGRPMSASRGTARLRGGLVMAEVALATTLIIGATLLVVSFTRLSRVDPGISPDRVLTLRLTLPAASYATNEALARGFDRLLDAVRAVPGVRSASAVTSLPLGGWLFGAVFTVDGIAPTGARTTSAHIQSIGRDYFATFGIPMIAGRELTATDTSASARVAIVNATFVARHIPDGRAIGRRIRMDGAAWEIVGVSRDVKTGGLADAPLATPEIYVPLSQSPAPTMFLAVRAESDDPVRLAPAIRTAVQRADPLLPVGRALTMTERIAGSVDTPRFRATLIGAFAMLAGILASLGVYAVRAQAVAGRRREIGIRVALGATRASVFRLVVVQGFAQVAVGLGAGVALAALLTRQVEPWLFATRTTDPAIIAAAVALLSAAALLASWGPARRAASVDPLTTLRQE